MTKLFKELLKKGTPVLLLMMLLSACTSEGASFTNVTPDQVKELIDNQQMIVLDVRTLAEFSEGHIPDAMLIPDYELESRLNELDKDTSYLVVCASCNRSTKASNVLANNGFTKINNITGGMKNWKFDIEK